MCVCVHALLRGTHIIMCAMLRETHTTLKLTYMISMGCVYGLHFKPVYIHTRQSQNNKSARNKFDTPGPSAGGDIGFFDLVKQRNNPRSGNVGEDSNIHEPVVYLTASKPGQFQSFLRRPALVCRHMLALTSQGGTHKQNTHKNREGERNTHTHTHTQGGAGRILRP